MRQISTGPHCVVIHLTLLDCANTCACLPKFSSVYS